MLTSNIKHFYVKNVNICYVFFELQTELPLFHVTSCCVPSSLSQPTSAVAICFYNTI